MSTDNNKAVKPNMGTLSNLQSDWSDEIKQKLAWFDHYERHGRNARHTCRHFRISPDTFYRWKRRYNANDHLSLVDNKKNRRPKRLREPVTPLCVVNRIQQLKERYPTWGRNRLWVLLKNEGLYLSAATVGRIISRLRKSGQLQGPIISRIGGEKKPNAACNATKPHTSDRGGSPLLHVWKK